MRLLLALFSSLVELFVVGERVRVGANDMSADERGAAALADVVDCLLGDGVRLERVGAVDLGDLQSGKIANQFGDTAARGLHFNGDGDGVAVVFDEVEEGKLFGAGGVKGFPEFAFAGGAVTSRNVDDFLGIEMHVLAQGSVLCLL